MAGKKTYRPIAPHNVLRVFDDVCMDRLAKIAGLPNTADRPRL
jgi:hypothetical protein